MNNSYKNKLNLTKRKFLKQMPVYFLGAIAITAMGQNIFKSLFGGSEKEVSLNSDSLFTARDHQDSLSCSCANCMIQNNQAI